MGDNGFTLSFSFDLTQTSPGQDVETGGAMSTQDYTTSERFPMIHRSPSTEFIEMGSAVLASSYISETLPMIHRGSTDKSMPGEGEVDHKSS